MPPAHTCFSHWSTDASRVHPLLVFRLKAISSAWAQDISSDEKTNNQSMDILHSGLGVRAQLGAGSSACEVDGGTSPSRCFFYAGKPKCGTGRGLAGASSWN